MGKKAKSLSSTQKHAAFMQSRENLLISQGLPPAHGTSRTQLDSDIHVLFKDAVNHGNAKELKTATGLPTLRLAQIAATGQATTIEANAITAYIEALTQPA
jgi:hypothetical protein